MSNQSPKKQKSSLQELKKQAQNKNDIQSFIRSYQLKQKAIKELVVIYSNHFFTNHFASTFKAAVALLVLPSFTNIYYAVRSNSILSNVMPFAVPIMCLTNYIYFLNKQMQQFALTNEPNAENARKQYEIIYQFSYYDRFNESFMKKLENFKQDQQSKQKLENI